MLYNKYFITGFALTTTLVYSTTVAADVVHKPINRDNLITYVSDEDWQPEGFENGTAIPATYLDSFEFTLDGKENEPEWEQAMEVEIPLVFGSTETASLKALYTEQEVFIRVRWADASENRQHQPWVWDADKEQYVVSNLLEDSVMLSFEAGCEWTPSLLSGYIYDFDAWHWLAARSDPLGQAVDLYGNVQDRDIGDTTQHVSRHEGNDWELKFTDNHDVDLHAKWDELDRVYMKQPVTRELYVKRVPDGGRRSPPYFEQLDAPSSPPVDGTQYYPQFSPIPLPGSAGEVAAKGHWEDGFWTVEFRRIRVTPSKHIDDTIFNRMVQFSVHVYDQTDQLDKSSESYRLFLQFLPEEPRLANE
jgi:hypothetical protein